MAGVPGRQQGLLGVQEENGDQRRHALPVHPSSLPPGSCRPLSASLTCPFRHVCRPHGVLSCQPDDDDDDDDPGSEQCSLLMAICTGWAMAGVSCTSIGRHSQ